MEMVPFWREKTSKEIVPSNDCLSVDQVMISNGESQRRYLSICNEIVDGLKKDVLEDRIGGDRRKAGSKVGDELSFEGKPASDESM